MNKEISKAYNHEEFEDQIYKNWEESGYFKPEFGRTFSYDRKIDGDPFVIMMPPPNVTGKLHIGHSLVLTLEDIMTRFHRLKGEPTLWLPGMDHAGIATQTVVDKALRKKGINKNEIGREEFVKKVWGWKEEYGGIILNQTRKMGASCDWSRERFTLDEGLSVAVRKAFVELYDKGLIYRDKYIVNWCPHCHTAIADDEVEYQDQTSKLYWIKYGPFVLATTRPETKLGDTAVAVNPSDKRYKDMIGKRYNIPGVLGEFEVVVVADPMVDPEFGSGAVKVTPAHSFVDFEIARKNKLPMKQIIDENGRMMENTGKYAGLKTLVAREAIVEDMEKMGLIDHIDDDYENRLSICYRCKSTIEPLPSLQWFVKMRPLAEKAIKAVKSGEIKIIPKRFEKSYFYWMENIPDWCVSRQLWWGHRLPVYYRKQEAIPNSKFLISNKNTNDQMPKTWNLKIYGQDVFDAIHSGRKSIETRAGKPEGSEKYWGDFKTGDRIIFTLADSKTDQPVMPIQTTEKIITKNTKFDNIDQLLTNKDIANISADSNEENYRTWWAKMPELESRIKKYGIWAIELKQFSNFRPKDDQPLAETIKQSNEDIYVGVEPPQDIENWTQDEDVLDTWFSSALWPFSTLGWPSKTPDFDYFYPTSVMETAYDILPFWVNRMIMMGLELTGQIPFKTVYLHGMVRDEQNRKMSKSLGNALDPLDLIPKYGTDALRMALVVGSTPGQDMAIGEPKIKGYRNFSNKIWNASRFVMLRVTNGDLQSGRIGEEKVDNLDIDQKILTKADKEVLRRHTEVIKSVTKKLDQFNFSQAGEEMYEFFWHQFCDNYIEVAKTQLGTVILSGNEESIKKVSKDPSAMPQDDNKDISENTKKILIKILSESLILMHPFIPFVTEAVWQELRKVNSELSESIMISTWPS